MPPCDLRQAGVLVTRPAHQADRLCRRISEAGGRPLAFPALEIQPAADETAVRECLESVRDLLIFVSPNAVSFGLMLLAGRDLRGLTLGAVGKGTARALRQAGHEVDLLPSERFDSEGLLALPQLQRLAGRQVVIVRGVGGRPLLGEVLAQRGAEVRYAEVYRRAIPAVDATLLLARWSRDVDLVTATSNDVLLNLAAMLGEPGEALLRKTPLLVISERMRQQALEMGIKTVLLATGADEDAILDRLCQWADEQTTTGKIE